MSVDLEAIRAGMPAAVPFIRTLGLEYDDVTETTAVLRMPDRPDLHNHVGGPHAGAIFALGESASGAVVLAAFADLLGNVTPLAAGADITYRKLALGAVRAAATLGRNASEVRAELADGGIPQFPVTVQILDGADNVTAEMNIRWALKPNRPAS
jgi:acyl-coenzyme A thioesterase PaaI-like protein